MKGIAYLLQATLVSLWWIGLLVNTEFYNAFQFPGISKIAFNSFLLPDITIIATLSIIRAYKVKQVLEYVILGGFCFATLYCINVTILSGGGYLSTTLMVLGMCYNFFLVFEQQMFRISNTNSLLVNSLKTIVQIICVWTITLIIFPVLLMKSFGNSFEIKESNLWIGLILFFIFSAIGIYSAYTMVKKGNGTPLPLDQTQKLVSAGPYKYVRNPMAIAGIGQGISVSIIFASIAVFLYAILGAILWHFVVRPIEEKDMLKRFGKEYEVYRSKVRCWIPKIQN